ncbi:MAG: DnaJ domain-containing protein [Cyanobacteria bacterium P01_G01_bin.19]
MSLAIKHGLFKLNLTDYHAILGVSLDAEPKQIRLSYLKIAQKLHPDKCRKDPQQMKLAGQILSKLVNPAYEQLSRKSNFAEHQLVLTQIGKRLAENKDKVTLTTEAARELLKAGDSAELVYRKLLKKLASDQYKSIELASKNIGAISELNLVYLMLQCDRFAAKEQARKVKANSNSPKPANRNNSAAKPSKGLDKQTIDQSKSTVSQKSAAPKKSTKAEEPSTDSRVNAFVGRAQQYIAKKDFDRAVTELRDALRIDPNHAVAHAVMGQAYLQKNQLTMAKVHIGKASKADPNNIIVMESQKALDKMTKRANANKNKGKKSSSNPNAKSSNSGFFSGFFGTKKK